ncbi:hypothetical protein [Calothrix sp. NIES-3974]|uniref:hypothetical protein n=1 Tax=Calothrix sp. NIES-3974 TaxID=2005462 RepID=UPI0012FD4ADA|nr:hypothetical protein [Calothrix sp. NIES-3974]
MDFGAVETTQRVVSTTHWVVSTTRWVVSTTRWVVLNQVDLSAHAKLTKLK